MTPTFSLRFSTRKICKSCCGAASKICHSSTSSRRPHPGEFLKDLLEFFRSCHDELRTPDDYDAYLTRVERKEIPLPRVGKSKDAEAMADDEVLDRCREIARVFRYVEDLLKQEGLGTFGHIITRAVDLLNRRQSVLQRAQKHARFILIDEFQDSNVAQIQLARLLAGADANVFAVGDPDQAIYRFRGATSGAFDQFLKTFGSGPREARHSVARTAARRRPSCVAPIRQSRATRLSPALNCTRAAGRASRWAARVLRATQPLANASAVQAVVHNGFEQEAVFVADTIAAMRQQRPVDEVALTLQCCTALIPTGKRCSPNFATATFPCTSRVSIFSTLRKRATPWRRCRSWNPPIPSRWFG